MGAWSHRIFDNDDAMDWVGELESAVDFGPISEAFDSVLELDDDFLEAPEASTALAAAEVVAALLGRPADGLPEEVTGWVAGKAPPRAGLVKKAQRVVRRVAGDSELKDLWADSPDSARWQQGIEGLLSRLGPA